MFATHQLHNAIWSFWQLRRIPVPIQAGRLEELALGVEVARRQIREACVVLEVPGEQARSVLGVPRVRGVVEPTERPLALSVHGKGVSGVAVRQLMVPFQHLDRHIAQHPLHVCGSVDTTEPTLAELRLISPSANLRHGVKHIRQHRSVQDGLVRHAEGRPRQRNLRRLRRVRGSGGGHSAAGLLARARRLRGRARSAWRQQRRHPRLRRGGAAQHDGHSVALEIRAASFPLVRDDKLAAIQKLLRR
mmetsp:Transcript_91560/g.296428  ORF Transcript_91560/g.296428 Transcript_91560/m.296428 type:complete len:247 (+) Transcript_91560:2182-2922(+)